MNTDSVAVYFKNLKLCQTNFFALQSINEYIKKNPFKNIQIFVDEASQECITPLCCVMGSDHIHCWDSPIICTDMLCLVGSTSTKAPLILNYVTNIIDFLKYDAISYDEIYNILKNDSRIVNVYKSQLDRDILTSHFNILADKIIEEFDTEKLIGVING